MQNRAKSRPNALQIDPNRRPKFSSPSRPPPPRHSEFRTLNSEFTLPDPTHLCAPISPPIPSIRKITYSLTPASNNAYKPSLHHVCAQTWSSAPSIEARSRIPRLLVFQGVRMNFPQKSLRASSASSAPPRSRPPSCHRAVAVQIPPLSKICCASTIKETPSSPNPSNQLYLRKRNRKNDLRRCAKNLRISPQKSAQVRKPPRPTNHGSRPTPHQPPSPSD